MKIRTKAILVIVLTNLVIIALSISVGVIFVRYDNERTLNTDLNLIADIADHFISAEIESLHMRNTSEAQIYSMLDDAGRQNFFRDYIRRNPEIIGVAVLSAGEGLIASAGEAPATVDVISHVQRVFTDGTALSSTYQTDTGTYFYAAASIPGTNDEILLATLPGLYFGNLLSGFRIWETGHIFMTDIEGYAISNPREHWVEDRFNYITIADVDESFRQLADTIKLMVRGDTGIGYYSLTGTGFSDTPRVCSYRPVSGSAEGWSLGVVAPTTENPARNTPAVLFLVGAIGLILNVVFAIFASNIIKKPYEEIVALKDAADTANATKSNFLATMSHEIRSPLNVIVGITNLRMEDSTLPDDIKEDITKINNAGDVLLGIVNDILDISKIEAGKIALTQTIYNTASILNDIITLNMIRIASKPINFIVDIDEDIPEELRGDELRIKQIFNNLLSNAFKYTDAGSVKLIVNHRKGKENHIWLDITISDTGIGIREKDLTRLFSDYSQVETDASRRSGGTGLGLVITKRLAELMGGDVSVKSEYGVGSTFYVSILQEAAGNATLGTDTVKKLCSFSFTDEKQHVSRRLVRDDMSYARVLIVDDYAANLDVAAGMIGKYKIKVDCVTSGKAAIDCIMNADPKYDAIFMDHMMPEMDGVEATEIIRSIDTEYAKKIPIIALTANAIAGNEKMFLSRGFNAFLPKPIDLMELDAVLRKWVRDKSAGHPHSDDNIRTDSPENAVYTDRTNNVDSQEKMDIDISIPGIDSQNLKQRYQNEPDIYIPALRFFAQDAAEGVEKMRHVSEDTLAQYCINAHGLKGISAIISANSITEQALELELLSKEGNIAGILEKNDTFLNNVTTLVGNIETWLKEYDNTNKKPLLKAPDPEVLQRLRICCEAFDIEGADRAVEELEKADYETDGELVSWLREKITDSQFMEITRRLS